jgi:hypothetical protein
MPCGDYLDHYLQLAAGSLPKCHVLWRWAVNVLQALLVSSCWPGVSSDAQHHHAGESASRSRS